MAVVARESRSESSLWRAIRSPATARRSANRLHPIDLDRAIAAACRQVCVLLSARSERAGQRHLRELGEQVFSFASLRPNSALRAPRDSRGPNLSSSASAGRTHLSTTSLRANKELQPGGCPPVVSSVPLAFLKCVRSTKRGLPAGAVVKVVLDNRWRLRWPHEIKEPESLVPAASSSEAMRRRGARALSGKLTTVSLQSRRLAQSHSRWLRAFSRLARERRAD